MNPSVILTKPARLIAKAVFAIGLLVFYVGLVCGAIIIALGQDADRFLDGVERGD